MLNALRQLQRAATDRRLIAGIRNRLIEWRLRRRLGFATTLSRKVTYSGDFSVTPETRALQAIFTRALNQPSHLPQRLRDMEGMSGQRYRAFINGLVSGFPDARYLEIGSWKGSTVCAALHGNSVAAVCIDNWSLFGGTRDEFIANTLEFGERLVTLEADFRNVHFSSLGRFNVYMFDGPHEEVDQYDGIMLVQPALEPSHILIVDDWNWSAVRKGTLRALCDADVEVKAAIEVRTKNNATPDWWNGYLLAALQKRVH